MEYRIFFKDKENELKGPFTERQVQEWYRKGWFDSSFPFFFTQGNESPLEKGNSGITLASLRSLNGIGCPFFKSNETEKRNDEKKKLECMEKEIAELHKQFDSILCLKKTIETAEREIQVAKRRPPGDSKSYQKTEFARPESIPADIWHKYYELGCSVSDLILDTFAVYGSGDFASWDKDRVKNMYQTLLNLKNKEAIKGRNAVCEYILVEKMKKKDFFFCSLCEMPLFNYKQVLIHFFCGHQAKDTAAVRGSGVDGIRRILELFTKLPSTLLEDDEKNEAERRRRLVAFVIMNGAIDVKNAAQTLVDMRELVPNVQFLECWRAKYERLMRIGNPVTGENVAAVHSSKTTETVVERVKSADGRRAMTELHNHMGQEKTVCLACFYKTGDREGFYAHCTSYVHLTNVLPFMKAVNPYSLCIFTVLSNLYKKELI